MTASSAAVDSAGALATPPARRPLRALALRGSAWAIGGHVAHQAVRLASNLVLTRLLFPEAFGLMALVLVYMQALQMFSDIGIGASIVQNARGEDRVFLRTAWTMQVLRGFSLWALSLAGAAPFAWFYGEPMLASLLPVAGLVAVFNGFNSTAMFTANRRLNLGRLTTMEVASYGLGVAVMIVWAWVWPTVWALIAGGIVTAAAKTALSHLWLAESRDWFGWEREAAWSLFRFGRWIFIGTALTFLLQQGDKAVLGGIVEMDVLGVYAIAMFWARAAVDVLLRLNHRVLFPVYSELSRERPDHLRSRLHKARLMIFAVFLPGLWALAVGGHWLIELLYDDRYTEAGWMLRILAVGGVGSVITAATGGVLLARGDSFRHMVLQVIRGSLLIVGMTVGTWAAGVPGFVFGVSAARIVEYPALAWAVRRHGVWMPRMDLAAYGASALVIGLGWWVAPLGATGVG